MHMVQRVELTRPGYDGIEVSDRKTEHDDGRHDESHPGEELWPLVACCRRQDARGFIDDHIAPCPISAIRTVLARLDRINLARNESNLSH